jgi:hypothetical protein
MWQETPRKMKFRYVRVGSVSLYNVKFNNVDYITKLLNIQIYIRSL